MTSMSKRVGWVCALGLCLVGCGSDDSNSGGGTSGITLSGKTVLAGLGTAVGNVEVCAPDLPKPLCTTSAADGTYTLKGIPKNQIVVFTGKATGFVPALGYFEIGDADIVQNIAFQEDKIVQSAFAPTSVTVDLTKASIGILVEDATEAGIAGVAASMAPSGGDGPFYGDTTGLKVDPAATATTTSGSALFVNMDAGKYTLTLTGAGTCTKNYLTVMTGDSTWDTELRAGYTTYHVVTCAP
jgi:hypothetical protein